MCLAGAIGAMWLARWRATVRMWRKRQVLGPNSYAGPPSPAPLVSVVLAAKDEQDNLEPCVTSLLAQDYPDFELIVVDDRSGDRTPEILSRLEASAAGRPITTTNTSATAPPWKRESGRSPKRKSC